MSYLLYCIFRSLPQPELDVTSGVQGKAVMVIDHGGLGAGFSELGSHTHLPMLRASSPMRGSLSFFSADEP